VQTPNSLWLLLFFYSTLNVQGVRGCVFAINRQCYHRQTTSWFLPWRCAVFTVRYKATFCRVLQQKLSSDIYQQPVRAEATLLHAFAKLRKATISFVMSVCLSASVCPSAWNIRLPLDGYSRNLIMTCICLIAGCLSGEKPRDSVTRSDGTA